MYSEIEEIGSVMRDIDTLIQLTRKLGEGICDAGTFEELHSKYLVIKWKYEGNAFVHKFPGTIKTSTPSYQYYQMRKNLRASGLGPPEEKAHPWTKEQRELLEDIWNHLGTDDEGGTPYGCDLEKQ